jgi:phytoene synthase
MSRAPHGVALALSPPMPKTTAIADARYCELVTQQHARTFSYASRFLPAEKRRAAFAVYAFCRTADDIVDNPIAGGACAARAIDSYRALLDRALAGAPDGPVFREIAHALNRFAIPPRVLHELISGVARDLGAAPQPTTWEDLAGYCEGVASTVGEMCAHVFGVSDTAGSPARAVRYARTLGMAMQVTNILRDIGEDAERGRCYLPADELAAFGLAREDILRGGPTLARDERWRPLMAFQIGRARALYEAAAPGLSMLAADARRCAVACAQGYAAILEAIEKQGYDTLTRRARVPVTTRARLLFHVWRDGAAQAQPLPNADGPFLRWDNSLRFPREAKWA